MQSTDFGNGLNIKLPIRTQYVTRNKDRKVLHMFVFVLVKMLSHWVYLLLFRRLYCFRRLCPDLLPTDFIGWRLLWRSFLLQRPRWLLRQLLGETQWFTLNVRYPSAGVYRKYMFYIDCTLSRHDLNRIRSAWDKDLTFDMQIESNFKTELVSFIDVKIRWCHRLPFRDFKTRFSRLHWYRLLLVIKHSVKSQIFLVSWSRASSTSRLQFFLAFLVLCWG